MVGEQSGSKDPNKGTPNPGDSRLERSDKMTVAQFAPDDVGIDIPLTGDVRKPYKADQSTENTERVLAERPSINRDPSPHTVETVPVKNGTVPLVLKSQEGVKGASSGSFDEPTRVPASNNLRPEGTPMPRRDAKPVNGQATNGQDVALAPGLASTKPQPPGIVEPASAAGNVQRTAAEAPRTEGGIAKPASDLKLASGANTAWEYVVGARAESKSQPQPQFQSEPHAEPRPVAESTQKLGEPVLGRSVSGAPIQDGTNGGAIESRAATTPGTKPQAEILRADGGVNRLEAMPPPGKDGPLTRGQQSGSNVEPPRPGSSESTNLKSELSAGTKTGAKPSENPGVSIESPTATSAKAPKLEPISPSQPQGVPPVKAGDVSVSPASNPQGRGMPEVPAGKAPQPHVSNPTDGAKSDGAKSNGTKSDGTKPPGLQPQSAEVSPPATGPDGKRIDVQIPTTKAGIAGGVKTDVPTSKTQTDATKSNATGNKGDANNPPGKPAGDVRTVRGQGATSANNSELDPRQAKERAVKQVEGREPGGDKTPKSPGAIEVTTKVPGNQNVAAEVDKTRVNTGKSDSKPTPPEAGVKTPSGIKSGGASSDAPLSASGKSQGADGGKRALVDAEPHQATGKFGPLDAAPAGIRRGSAGGVRGDVNPGSKGEQTSSPAGRRGGTDVQPTKGSVAPGIISGKPGESALAPQPGKRGDAGLTPLSGRRGDASAAEPQFGGRPIGSASRRPLIEGARVDVGSARTDGPNGRAARAEAIDGRAGSGRSQGVDGRGAVAGVRSGRAGDNVEASGPRGAKRAFGESGKGEGSSKVEGATSEAVKSDAAKVQTARIEPTKVPQVKIEATKIDPAKFESGKADTGKAPEYKGAGAKAAGALGAAVGEFVKANFDNAVKANTDGIKYGAVEGAKIGTAGGGRIGAGEGGKVGAAEGGKSVSADGGKGRAPEGAKSVSVDGGKISTPGRDLQVQPQGGAKNFEPNAAKLPLGGVIRAEQGAPIKGQSANPVGKRTADAVGDRRASDGGDSRKLGDKRISTDGTAKKGPFELAPGSLDYKPVTPERPKPPAALPQAENPHGIVRGDKFTAKPLTSSKQPFEQGKPLAAKGDGGGLNEGLGAPLRGVRDALGDLGQKFIEKISRTLGESKVDLTKTQPIKLVHGMELAKLLSAAPKSDVLRVDVPRGEAPRIEMRAESRAAEPRTAEPRGAERRPTGPGVTEPQPRVDKTGRTDVPRATEASPRAQAPRGEMPARAEAQLQAATVLTVTRRMLNGVADVVVSDRAIEKIKLAPRLETPTAKSTALHRLEAAAINAATVPVIDRAHHKVEIRTQQPADARLQQPLEIKPTPAMEAHTVRVEQSEFRPMIGRSSAADGATKGFDRLQKDNAQPGDRVKPKDARPQRRDGEPVDGRHEGEAPKHIRDVFLKFNIAIPKRSFHPAITDSGSYVALDDTSSQRLNAFISSGTHRALKDGTEYERRSNRSGWQTRSVEEGKNDSGESGEDVDESHTAKRSAAYQDEDQLKTASRVGTTGDTARKVYIVQSGDTAESIALVQLRDERLDGLIEEINHLLLQRVFDANKGEHVRVLPVGAMILLPNQRDIAKYRERTASD